MQLNCIVLSFNQGSITDPYQALNKRNPIHPLLIFLFFYPGIYIMQNTMVRVGEGWSAGEKNKN